MSRLKTWEDCTAFHGHKCPGLAMGYRASLYAIELLGLDFSGDEEVVCISENDACGVDAVQVVLGCSVGKGNLLFHMTGKHAYSFYSRGSGKSVRLILKEGPRGMSREESIGYYLNEEAAKLFETGEAVLKVPEPARRFKSYICENCGELTAENWIRLQDGKKLCIDCYEEYDRFRAKNPT